MIDYHPPTTPPAGLCKSIDQSGLRRVFAFFCCWVPLSPPRDPPRDPLSDPAGNRRKSRNRASPTRRGLESLGALGRYNETSGRFPSLRSEKNGLPGDSSLHPRPPRCRLPPNRPEKPRQPPPPRRPPAPSPAKRQNLGFLSARPRAPKQNKHMNITNKHKHNKQKHTCVCVMLFCDTELGALLLAAPQPDTLEPLTQLVFCCFLSRNTPIPPRRKPPKKPKSRQPNEKGSRIARSPREVQ